MRRNQFLNSREFYICIMRMSLLVSGTVKQRRHMYRNIIQYLYNRAIRERDRGTLREHVYSNLGWREDCFHRTSHRCLIYS